MHHGSTATLADVLYSSRSAAWWQSLLLIAAGSLLVALTAQLSVPVPFSPVPITGQTFGVVLVGALLGSRRGAAALTLYVAEGAAGLPVFAGGAFGLHHLAGPSGGYLAGFIVAAWATGALAERGWDRRIGTATIAMALGQALILAIGAAWLAGYVGGDRAWALGVQPFLLGALVKLVAAAALLPAGWRLVGARASGPR